MKAKRKLVGIKFDFEGAGIALTDASQGGACSGKNDFYLAKNKEEEVNKSLTENQKRILERLGHKAEDLEVKKSATDAAETGSSVDNLNKTMEKSNEMSMSKEDQERFDQLEKDLKAATAKNVVFEKANAARELEGKLSGLGLEGEALEKASELFASIEAEKVESVLEVCKSLVAKTEEVALNKAKEEDNVLQKSLSKDEGYDGEPELSEEEKQGKEDFLAKAMRHAEELNKGVA